MVRIDVTCLSCYAVKEIHLNGCSRSGHQRYLCQSRRHSWSLEFIYTACRPDTHKQSWISMNGMGCRAIARVTGIGLNIYCPSPSEKLSPKSITEAIFPSTKVIVCGERDKP
ncbi:transposase [Xenorhabdus sp. PB62.4]|nr:transposase [Xenorhabdus sp. PB62.4]